MEEEVLALKVVNESLKLPGVKVNRNAFLTKMFQDKVDNVQELFDDGPEKVLSKKELDRAAQKCINQAVMQSSAISFATGIPGGLAMAATIPADIAQFYGYSLKLAQEISYIYGYHDLWNNQDELTEEAKNTLILYLGIMLGVTSAGSVVRILSNRLSIQALKRLPQKALTKTFLFPILKKILAVFGTKLTKATFAKGVSKAIPVLGGVVSGGINYASMKPMAMRLKDELSKNIGYTQEDAEKDLEILEADFEVISEQPETETTKYTDDIFSKLERAHALFEKKILTEAEYIKLKETIIQEG
ncbi:bacteriochlorophyll 4-vinyl reductase [Enterococcus faecalis]|uniref:Bacteriochlorophyll 4-vinyl reductase n=1 Tax=Enterococcus faecalis TaxID=1351 RepID=A0A4U3LL50_ENTFL|nr:EcsC family protein [Enterococcus faecalis]TKK75794.1 bacteriochlorophyll 4-vinyl reductase [Enterococcus faecalis]